MTNLSIAAALVGIGCGGIIYGTDVFCALVLRSAAAVSAPASIADLIGHIHEFGDRRLPVPGVVSMLAAVVATVFSPDTIGHVCGGVAVAALVVWLAVYVRISAPINKRLTEAADARTVPDDTRSLQQRWDSVIWIRAGLQTVALAGLLVVALSR